MFNYTGHAPFDKLYMQLVYTELGIYTYNPISIYSTMYNPRRKESYLEVAMTGNIEPTPTPCQKRNQKEIRS